MSQMIPFQQSALPAHLQQAAAGVQDNMLAATGTGGVSVDHISIKGGRFHVVRAGQQPVTLQLFALQVVILQANSGVTKAFFDKPWVEGQEPEAPVCSSDDGVVPRADSDKPQCNTCAACPNNVFGSKITEQGKQAKLCIDKKTVAIVTPGAEDGEMLRLQIPAASLKDFGAYMRSLPVKYCYVVTEITFDTTVSFPKLLFKPVGYVSEQGAAIIARRHDTDEAKAIAGIAGATPMRAPAPAAAQLPAPPAYAQQIPVQQLPVEPQVQQHVYQQPVQQPAQQQAAGGFGQPVAEQPQVQQTYQQPVQQFAQPAVSQAPAVDPGVAAIFGGQAQQPIAQQVQQQAPQGNVHPSGREYGKPSQGKQRRTKVEMAEDAAVGIGRAAGEAAEDDVQQAQQPVQHVQQPVQQPVHQPVQQAAQQPEAGGFGQPVQQAQQPMQQPAGQPQIIAADAFAGWDD